MKTIRELRAFLGVEPGDKWGPVAQAALDAIIDQPPAKELTGEVDARSEKNISTLHPRVRTVARAFILKARQNGINLKITSGTRTREEQAELYRKYKAGTGGKAAAPGYSNHEYGIAFDVTIFKPDNKTPIWESPKYREAGKLGQSMGLSWGGAFGDEPHYALRPEWAKDETESRMITELRFRKTTGKDAFA